ncbi:14416_t:CDS:1, partial [Funneliformis geosporum]
DKHHCKIRTPNYLVAAIEHKKSVIVAKEITFIISNYNLPNAASF